MGNKEISRKWLKWLELKGSAELATKYERLDNNDRKLQKKKKKKKKKNFFLLNYKNLSTINCSWMCFQSTSGEDSEVKTLPQ